MKKKKIPCFYEKKGKNWTAYYHAVKIKGKMIWTKLGTDRATALRKWAEMEVREAPAEVGTVKAVMGTYLKWAAGEVAAERLAERTLRDREGYAQRILKPFGEHLLESIEPKHIRLYLDNRKAKIVGKKEMRFFSVLWNWARERGITAKTNPVAGVKMPEEVGRTIVVSNQDYWLVYEMGDQLVRDVLLLAARLGTRPQEVFDLQWKNISFSDAGVAVNVWQNKTKQWRTVMGSTELADQLKALRDTIDGDATYVLCKKDGKPLKITGTFRVSFGKAREAAASAALERGLAFTSFQLRDVRPMAGIEMLLKNGMDAARQLLGHSTEKMTAHYTTKRTGMVSAAATRTVPKLEVKKDDDGEPGKGE